MDEVGSIRDGALPGGGGGFGGGNGIDAEHEAIGLGEVFVYERSQTRVSRDIDECHRFQPLLWQRGDETLGQFLRGQRGRRGTVHERGEERRLARIAQPHQYDCRWSTSRSLRGEILVQRGGSGEMRSVDFGRCLGDRVGEEHSEKGCGYDDKVLGWDAGVLERLREVRGDRVGPADGRCDERHLGDQLRWLLLLFEL